MAVRRRRFNTDNLPTAHATTSAVDVTIRVVRTTSVLTAQ